MALPGEKSSLKRERVPSIVPTMSYKSPVETSANTSMQASAGEAPEQKKVRRSARLSQLPPPQEQQARTPLDPKSAQLPSPLTRGESTATESFREGTITPMDGHPSQIPSQQHQHQQQDHLQHTPSSSPDKTTEAGARGGLSSPPADTQPFSQFVLPSQSLVDDVVDEKREGVWGYLQPLDGAFDETLVLRRRTACPAPDLKDEFGCGGHSRANGDTEYTNFEEEEDSYEKTKVQEGPPSGGYLIGRHPECGRRDPPFPKTLAAELEN